MGRLKRRKVVSSSLLGKYRQPFFHFFAAITKNRTNENIAKKQCITGLVKKTLQYDVSIPHTCKFRDKEKRFSGFPMTASKSSTLVVVLIAIAPVSSI